MIIPLSLRKKETYNPFKKTGTTSDLSLILLGSGLCNVHVRPWLYSSTSTSPMSSNEGTIKLPARITTTHSGTSSTPRQKWLIRMVIQNTTTTTNSNKWGLFIGISKERKNTKLVIGWCRDSSYHVSSYNGDGEIRMETVSKPRVGV